MIAYKLFRVRKNGTIAPLFINRTMTIPVGEWLNAECHPTKGFQVRAGWHVMAQPKAPHLTNKGRQWFKVEIESFAPFTRPSSQGGLWYLAQKMKVLETCEELN
jgi:hypothetical protein